MWIQTGSLRHSPCFQMATAGKVNKGTSDGEFGNHCCCCCTSGPGENEHEIWMPLDGLGDLLARGQM